MKKILLFIALVALLASSLIDSMSSIQGTHSIKDNVSCESCHQDVVKEFQQSISPYPIHQSIYTCKECHSSTTVHAAQIKTCTSCHPIDHHQIKYPNCSTCHQPHGGQITHEKNQCMTCHGIDSLPPIKI
jgi:hypothetical protein